MGAQAVGLGFQISDFRLPHPTGAFADRKIDPETATNLQSRICNLQSEFPPSFRPPLLPAYNCPVMTPPPDRLTAPLADRYTIEAELGQGAAGKERRE